jgi:hypothetical protein
LQHERHFEWNFWGAEVTYYASRISEHLAKTKEGYLLALDVPLCRSGTQDYRLSELGIHGTENDDTAVVVYRPPEAVLDPACQASFVGKVITDDHPSRMLDPSNTRNYQCGHVLRVRPGPDIDGEVTLIGDLLITDAMLIEKILSMGKREISAGYDAMYIPRDDGTLVCSSVRANHIAVVARGRAGHDVAIMDTDAVNGDYSASLRKFHRKNAIEVVAGAKNRHITHERMAVLDSGGKMDNSKKLDQIIDVLSSAAERRSSLGAEASSIVRSAKRTEDLIASGCGPATFHQALAEANPAYREYCREQERGESYSDALRAEGQRQRAKWYPTNDSKRGCRHPVNDAGDSEEDWASRINRMGRELRK